jgi:isopenicillin N synthase-like dioxygenase
MSSNTTVPKPSFTKLELRTAYGPAYRDVSTAPPRDCEPTEIPVIDVSGIYGDLEARKALAQTVSEAAENTGFLYIKNHGIPEEVINAALGHAKAFFHQPESEKEKVSRDKSCYFSGWSRRQTSRASPSESLDNMEQFAWCYDPKYDPEVKDLDNIPEAIKSELKCEDYIWDGTAHLPHFKRDCIRYWQECVQLTRRLLKIFALGLDLPENYFDNVTTYPGR